MAQALIRNLSDSVLATYRRRALEKGRSLEAELRDVLTSGARLTSAERLALADEIQSQMPSLPAGSDSADVIRFYRDTHGGRWANDDDAGDRLERRG